MQWLSDDYPFYTDLRPIPIDIQITSIAPENPCLAEQLTLSYAPCTHFQDNARSD
jgi:hypothetical protein